jgi:hypothetical protein
MYGCISSRDSKSLAWKLSHGDYKLVGVSKESTLVGLFATLQKSNDKQVLICELLVDGEANLGITLKAALLEADKQLLGLSEEQPTFNKVALLAPAVIQPALEELGFTKEKYTFYALVHLFDPNLTSEEVAPENWYFSAKD